MTREAKEEGFKMKRVVLVIVGLALSIVLSPAIIPTGSKVLGDPAGCCKQRQADNPASPWYRNRANFAACQQLNRTLDNNDDIFQQKGRIWWDQACP